MENSVYIPTWRLLGIHVCSSIRGKILVKRFFPVDY